MRRPGADCSITLRKAGTDIPLDQKESLFVWAPAKTSGPNLFFIREIHNMTGISIDETGDLHALFLLFVFPNEGNRSSEYFLWENIDYSWRRTVLIFFQP